jgi:2-succinyl-6-hydroxy-2,4-cyclohexadiene-1-carboxylate synthase
VRDQRRTAPAEPESLVLLHGFAGTSRAWDGVLAHLPRERYRPQALDLPGHGSLAVVAGEVGVEEAGLDPASVGETDLGEIDLDQAVASVLERSPPRFTLCGYSLGGRLALQVALAAPERVSSLTLIASGPGIEDAGERAERRAADRALADEIEHGSIERFAERWCAQPMFASDPPAVEALARADYLRNDPRSLAAVLRGLGQGEMASLWERLGELRMPVTAMAGDRDQKFQAIARRMVKLLPEGRLQIVPGGHRLPLESPAAVAVMIELSPWLSL